LLILGINFSEVNVMSVEWECEQRKSTSWADDQRCREFVNKSTQGIWGAQSDLSAEKRAESESLRLTRALRALTAVNQTLVRATGEQTLLSEVCRTICEVGGYRMAWVGYKEDDPLQTLRPVAWWGHEDGYLNRVTISWGDNEFGQGPASSTIRTGNPEVLRNTQTDIRIAQWQEAATQRGYASILGTPLLAEGKPFGSLTIYSTKADAFDREEMALLQQLADDLAFGIIALRARAERDRAENALRESEERYRVLVETAPAGIGIHQDGKWVYVNAAAVRMMGAPSEAEMIGESIFRLFNFSEADMVWMQQRVRRVLEGIPGEPIQVARERPDGSIAHIECRAVRLMHQGAPAVLVIFLDITAEKLAEQELKFSREQLRKLAAYLQSAREAERTHLAREIHDELGQYLTGLKMDVVSLEELINQPDADDERSSLLRKVQTMSQLLDTTVQSVRKIASELRPAVLDNLGLLAAIEWQAEEFQRRTGIRCECYLIADELKLDRDCATAVFRILQESLTNVMRHADATRVTITLEQEAGHYLIEIKDDGKGIQAGDLDKSASFGLLGMKERAHLFGGGVSIHGEPGKGTTVVVKIPLQADGERDEEIEIHD
jgi:PAS domain S-box-containing protein